jgi:hypothetical protein
MPVFWGIFVFIAAVFFDTCPKSLWEQCFPYVWIEWVGIFAGCYLWDIL